MFDSGSLTHAITLTEQHEISCDIDTPISPVQRAILSSDARHAAHTWGQDNNVDIVAADITRPDTVGVTFQVLVCTAVASPPSAIFRWRWGHRWRDWLTTFSGLRRAERFAPAHPVIKARREHSA